MELRVWALAFFPSNSIFLKASVVFFFTFSASGSPTYYNNSQLTFDQLPRRTEQPRFWGVAALAAPGSFSKPRVQRSKQASTSFGTNGARKLDIGPLTWHPAILTKRAPEARVAFWDPPQKEPHYKPCQGGLRHAGKILFLERLVEGLRFSDLV